MYREIERLGYDKAFNKSLTIEATEFSFRFANYKALPTKPQNSFKIKDLRILCCSDKNMGCRIWDAHVVAVNTNFFYVFCRYPSAPNMNTWTTSAISGDLSDFKRFFTLPNKFLLTIDFHFLWYKTENYNTKSRFNVHFLTLYFNIDTALSIKTVNYVNIDSSMRCLGPLVPLTKSQGRIYARK